MLAAVCALAVLGLGACADDPSGPAANGATTAPSAATGPTTTSLPAPDGGSPVGEPDVGDPLTPGSGNGGFDVGHYDVRIDATAPDGHLSITTTITATATRRLERFDLDLAGMEVGEVTVDGAAAGIERHGDELQVTPAAPVDGGREMEVVVRYSGVPEPVLDGALGEEIGWTTTSDGDSFVVSEPDGAKSFLASSDHPSDKATFTFRLRTAADEVGVANGVLESRQPDGGAVEWVWQMRQPMATYLVQVAIGDYELVDGGTAGSVPIRHVVVQGVTDRQRAPLDATAEIVDLFTERFGPYPFDTVGVLVADSPPSFALETQGLVILPAVWFTGGMPEDELVLIVAHELAHQWFGNAVTPARWSDIWLNEGFATWAEWWWSEHLDTGTIAARAEATVPLASKWRRQFGPIIEPTALTLFSPNQYGGAGLVVEALRRTIGDEAFDRLIREWLGRHSGTSVTTDDFTALAEEVSGRDLDAFFDAWLRSTKMPDLPPLPR